MLQNPKNITITSKEAAMNCQNQSVLEVLLKMAKLSLTA